MLPADPETTLTPHSTVHYKGVTYRVEGRTPTHYHLSGLNDPTCFDSVKRSEIGSLISGGAMSVTEDPSAGLDLLNLPSSIRKRVALKFTWLQLAERALERGYISNFSRASCQKLIDASSVEARDAYFRLVSNHSIAEPIKSRKTHFGAASPNRPGSYRDEDSETLAPGAKTLETDIKRWIASGRDIRVLIPNWGNQTGGGVKMDPRTWDIIEKNCLIYARENRRTMSGCVEFINAVIVQENAMLGPEAQIQFATMYAVRKAIDNIPEFVKAFSRKGPEQGTGKLRHAGKGPRFTRLGEEVLFDCWQTHLFTVLSEEVQELFQAAREVRLMFSLAIDQATDYVPAFAVAPGAETAELTTATLEMVVTDKTELARAAGAKSNWEAIPIESSATDNGSAYWNLRFLHGQYVLCDSVDHKAAGHKRLRAPMERFLRTIDLTFVQTFIARTGSNILDRHENDPALRAAIYADFFNRLFVRWLVDVYHYRPIGKGRRKRPAPARALEEARKIQCKALPNSDMLRLAFGIVTTRILNREGIRFMNVVYYSTWLDEPLQRKGPHEVTIKYHPRDMGQISVHLNNRWVTIPGPIGLLGMDLQSWIEYLDQTAREIDEQARVDFETYVAPALLAINAGARHAERALDMKNVDWTDELATAAERSLRTFVVYRREPLGAELGLSGQSDKLGTAFTRGPEAAALRGDGTTAAVAPELPLLSPDETPEASIPVSRKAPRTRGSQP